MRRRLVVANWKMHKTPKEGAAFAEELLRRGVPEGVGETLEERETGRTDEVLARQIAALDGFAEAPPGLALAYEPVWAIGSGRSASPEMAAETHAALRRFLERGLGRAAAKATRIL